MKKTIYMTKSELAVIGIMMAIVWIVAAGAVREVWNELEMMAYGFRLDASLSFAWLCECMLGEVWRGLAFGFCSVMYLVMKPGLHE